MRLRHFIFGLGCFVAAGIYSTRQTVEITRTGYRIEDLRRERIRLEEARGRLEAAIALHERPDYLLGRAAAASLPLMDPSEAAAARDDAEAEE